jgi:hypothetical protein
MGMLSPNSTGSHAEQTRRRAAALQETSLQIHLGPPAHAVVFRSSNRDRWIVLKSYSCTFLPMCTYVAHKSTLAFWGIAPEGAEGFLVKVKTFRSSHGRMPLRVCALALMLLGIAAASRAQALNTSFGTVNLQANRTESLSVTAGPGTVNFALAPLGGIAAGSAPVVINTQWILNQGRNRVRLYAYFSNAAAALSSGATNIPSSRVLGSANGGPFRTFTRNSPFGPARSVRIFNQVIRNNNRTGQRTDQLQLEINTTGLTLPPGIYTGLLLIQAQAI